MDPTALALLALLLGVIVGVGVSLMVAAALRARRRIVEEGSRRLPQGVAGVLGAMDDAAAAVDASGVVAATSPQATLLGMNRGETLADEDLRDLVTLARDTGAAASETLRIRRGKIAAETRSVVACATRITDRFVLLLVRDITEQERLEQMRNDFIANTSHELKTPIGAITLLAEAIGSAADDPDQVRSFSERLSGEAERLSLLTGRIMALSRLQAADELAEVGDVRIDEVVAGAVESHQLQADSAGVTLVRGGERGLYVRGDAQILGEAVGNLIVNAIAYSPRGSRVGVGVKAESDAVEIVVTDQGIGIPEADQQRIFERFYRADQARSRRTGGTGLGLSIVKHAVQRHGGEVRLWSRPNQGSTFTVRLPRSEPPETPRRSASKLGLIKQAVSAAPGKETE